MSHRERGRGIEPENAMKIKHKSGRRKTLTVGTKPKKKKQRRRSRSIITGRDWSCKFCSKSYLSTNSLVFHVRQKHNGIPAGKTYIQELFAASSALRMRAKSDCQLEDNPIEESKQQRIEEATLAALPHLLRQENVAGGPISPLTCVGQVIQLLIPKLAAKDLINHQYPGSVEGQGQGQVEGQAAL